MIADALAGITVLDFSQAIAAPYGARLLADMGATVIKVEPPDGDFSRRLGEPYGESAVSFNIFNCGKRGIVLDLKNPTARQAALRLIERADVLFENNRPGVMKRLELDWVHVSTLNPRLIYASVTGFGQGGPYAQRPATDILLQAYTGLALGASPDDKPIRIQFALVDLCAGLFASQAVLAALLRRARSGVGQHLDISLAHVAAAVQNYKIAQHRVADGRRQDELFAGIGIYATRDGYLAISAMRDKYVLGLLQILGLSDLVADPRFSTSEARTAQQAALRERIAAAIRKRGTDELLAAMEAADLMGQKVLDYGELMADVHARATGLFHDISIGNGLRLPIVRLPGAEEGETVRRPAPRLGQDTYDVLSGAGVHPEVAAELAASVARQTES